MDDFISMSCPVCGAPLEVSKKIITQKCNYCGTEHMIRMEAGTIILESYARCPKCKRNDQVKKLSVFSGNINKPSPPPRPEPTSDPGLWYASPILFIFYIFIPVIIWFAPISIFSKFILTFILAGGVAAPFLIDMPLDGNDLGYYLLLILMIIIILYLFSIYRESQVRKAKDEKAILSWDEEMEIFDNALNKWNALYHCGRDDCVFDSITNESTSRELLYKLLPPPYNVSDRVENVSVY